MREETEKIRYTSKNTAISKRYDRIYTRQTQVGHTPDCTAKPFIEQIGEYYMRNQGATGSIDTYNRSSKNMNVGEYRRTMLLLLLFACQPLRGVCLNHEVAMLQPWTATPLYLGSVINCYVR